MAKKITSFILLFWGVFFAQNAVFAATATVPGPPFDITLISSKDDVDINETVNIRAIVHFSVTTCNLAFGDGRVENNISCGLPGCSYNHSYAEAGDKIVGFVCTWYDTSQYVSVTIHVAGVPEPCIPNGCGGYPACPPNCTLAEDPDCGCLGGNDCCAPGCDFTTDSDCPPAPTCQTNGLCDQNCPPHCTLAEDPDCGCWGGNDCCPTGLGCNISNDSDCPLLPDQYDNPLSRDDIIGLLQQTIETIFGLLMGLAILLIIIGGYVMGTSGGIPSRFDKGKKIVIWALIGFAVSGASRGIIALVEMIIGKQ